MSLKKLPPDFNKSVVGASSTTDPFPAAGRRNGDVATQTLNVSKPGNLGIRSAFSTAKALTIGLI